MKIGKIISKIYQIRTTDTNIDDISERFSGKSSQFFINNTVSKFTHMCKNSVDLRHDLEIYCTKKKVYILAVNKNRCICSVAQRNMKNSPIFSEVDLVTSEHCITQFFDMACLGKLN